MKDPLLERAEQRYNTMLAQADNERLARRSNPIKSLLCVSILNRSA
jgi:hypothetical protein